MANVPIGSPSATNRTLFSGTAAATASGDSIPGADSFTSADFFFKVTAASGTSPTLDVYIQKLLPDNSTWQDIVHFAQATSTTNALCSFVSNASSAPAASQTASLTAGTQKATLLGKQIRVSYVIGGTNPSFTFSVWGDFYA